jgi:hypothetical protein
VRLEGATEGSVRRACCFEGSSRRSLVRMRICVRRWCLRAGLRCKGVRLVRGSTWRRRWCRAEWGGPVSSRKSTMWTVMQAFVVQKGCSRWMVRCVCLSVWGSFRIP